MTAASRPRVYRRRFDAKLSVADVRRAWLVYDRGGLSLRQLAAQLWHRRGFASAKSCANALHDAFAAEGYELRDRVEATVAASTTHGLRPRTGPLPGYLEVRARRRRERGEVRGVACAGVVDGRPCQRPALAHRDYCIAHDPDRAEQRAAILARARARRVAP